MRRVRRFVEKPGSATARRFLRRGGYLWNAGIFCLACAGDPPGDRDLRAAAAPGAGPLRGDRGEPAGDRALARAYRRAPSLPIDAAVMERSRRVVTLPVRSLERRGTWASLAEELGRPGRSR
jgi:mannose-1-phosphate guanylyltransferase